VRSDAETVTCEPFNFTQVLMESIVSINALTDPMSKPVIRMSLFPSIKSKTRVSEKIG